MSADPRMVDPRRAGPPFAVGVLAVLGTLPVVTTLNPMAGVPQWLAVVGIIAGGVGVVGLAAVVGAALAPDVGLRALAVDQFPEGLRAYRLPAAAGVGVGIVTLGLHAAATALGADPVVLEGWAGTDSPGVVASVAVGVITELVFRFGVMTFVVWTAWTYRPAIDRGVTTGSVWTGVVVAAVAGGVASIPAAVAGGGDLLGVAIAVALPAVGGVVFGLLYWRYDLAAAVLAHGVASLLRAVVSLL